METKEEKPEVKLQKPTLGRVIHYTLTKDDADKIINRRTNGPSVKSRATDGHWPHGAQAHVGSVVREGDVVAGTVTAVKPFNVINAQIALDGNDQLWVVEVGYDADGQPGTWRWPPRA